MEQEKDTHSSDRPTRIRRVWYGIRPHSLDPDSSLHYNYNRSLKFCPLQFLFDVFIADRLLYTKLVEACLEFITNTINCQLLILGSVRRRRKNIDSSSKSNPLRRRRENYDASTWRRRRRHRKNKESRRTFNKNSCDLLTAITHTEILVAYFW